MKDATTLDLPTPMAREDDRQQIALAVAEFLASGGKIQSVEPIRAQLSSANWQDKPHFPLTPRRARRSQAQEEQALVDRIKSMAYHGASRASIRRNLGMALAPFEQLLARNGIRIADSRKTA